ncbi:hypothetical protein [Streptomyces sp. TP-A0356]|uniref:hypothetical protein n=1 Tax=Streptomyces sp. TP-A0356 TaxID=1359208 RepID=UPI0006E1761D|nr:hypothetical protein [Streptomyces sp. TP-A0356]
MAAHSPFGDWTRKPFRDWYEAMEQQAAEATEQLVSGSAFAELLGLTAGNFAALTRISGETCDLMLRNMRLAGRADMTRLGHQLARTEDKLERVLQEVEDLRDQLPDRSADEEAGP